MKRVEVERLLDYASSTWCGKPEDNEWERLARFAMEAMRLVKEYHDSVAAIVGCALDCPECALLAEWEAE
jgi:hypothetical protein